MWIADTYRSGVGQVQSQTTLALVSLLMLFDTAFLGLTGWMFVIPSLIFVMAGLLHRPLLLNGWFWLGIAALATARILYLWHDVDNNGFIYFYWLWILVIAHYVDEDGFKNDIVQFNARYFLVFIMLLAVVRKVTSGTYLDGSFFELVMLTDERFRGFLTLFGVDQAVLSGGSLAIKLLKNPYVAVTDNTVLLGTNAYIRFLAKLVTWYDLLIQLLIGAAFLIRRPSADIIGHIALLVFIFTAYFAAPVIGFSWILAIMGIALAKKPYPNIAMVYLLSFGVMTMYEVPWQAWVT